MSERLHPTHGFGHLVAGLVIAFVLTAVPFGVVLWGGLPRSEVLVIVGFAGISQLLVQMHFFLGIGVSSVREDNGIALLFAALLIFIMVGGTLWIMTDLGSRMMG